MEDKKPLESHVSSAVAFVEGGVQDACEDACSICLDPFSDNDPATVTTCKHEYHLQCILEWAQRSKECPMCWQDLSLKDPTSQELLVAVEQERSIRSNRSPTNSSMLARNSLDEFEFHQVAAYGDESDLEERIMQHLAAAAIGRPSYLSRRENQRQRSSSGQGHHPQFVLFTTRSNAPPTSPDDGSESHESSPRSNASVSPVVEDQAQQGPVPSSPLRRGIRAFGNGGFFARTPEPRFESNSPSSNVGQQSSENQQSSRTPELQSFSETLKSRFNAVSARYKETITRGTRGFREKLLARNNPVTELGREVQREVTAGVARMMERFDQGNKNSGMSSSAVVVNTEGSSATATVKPVNIAEGFQHVWLSEPNGGSSSSNSKAVCPIDDVSEKCVQNVEGITLKEASSHATDHAASSV